MINDEKQIMQNSIKILCIGAIICLMIAFILKDISIVLGYLLGYLINLLNFNINKSSIQFLLDAKLNRSLLLAMFGFLIRMLLYAGGFLIAVLIPNVFCLYSVAVGYLSMRLTIYYLQFLRKEGGL